MYSITVGFSRYYTVGAILLPLAILTQVNPIKRFRPYIQPMFLPKRFDNLFLLILWMLRRFRCVQTIFKKLYRTYRRHPCRTTARYANSHGIHPQGSNPQRRMAEWSHRLNPVQCRSGHATGIRVPTGDGDPHYSRITHLRGILRLINDYQRISILKGTNLPTLLVL